MKINTMVKNEHSAELRGMVRSQSGRTCLYSRANGDIVVHGFSPKRELVDMRVEPEEHAEAYHEENLSVRGVRLDTNTMSRAVVIDDEFWVVPYAIDNASLETMLELTWEIVGRVQHSRKLVEECNELGLATHKLMVGRGTMIDFVGELVDVEILSLSLRKMLGITDEEYAEVRNNKIERFRGRLDDVFATGDKKLLL